MAEVKWIKIVTDIFDDPKIRFIRTLPSGDTIVVIWFELLCLAGKCNQNGFLMMTETMPYTEEMLASVFGDDIKMIQLALKTFESLNMIEIIDNRTYLTNWEKHQNAEKLATIRAQTRERVAKLRKRAESNAKSVTPALQESYGNTDVTQQNKNKKEDIERDNKESIEKTPDEPAHTQPQKVTPAEYYAEQEASEKKRFHPPTVGEVLDYCNERKSQGHKNNVDPERFVDFYSAKGWMIGKNKIKDWKACVRTWEKRDGQKKQSQSEHTPTFDIDEYERESVYDTKGET